MSDTTLRDLVLKRLDADTKPEDEWPALVLAALEGPAELESSWKARPVGSPSPFGCDGGRGVRRPRKAPSPQPPASPS